MLHGADDELEADDNGVVHGGYERLRYRRVRAERVPQTMKATRCCLASRLPLRRRAIAVTLRPGKQAHVLHVSREVGLGV
jgi:hypothetical protein